MKNEMEYKSELLNIYKELQKSYRIKINFISSIKSIHYINKLVKLNKKTKNEHIDEIKKVIGIARGEYKKYCRKNNYIPATEVNTKFKNMYIKLSRKSLNMKTTKKGVKNAKMNAQIEYNSDKGCYYYECYKDGKRINHTEYKIKSVKFLNKKREYVLKKLTNINFGINIFDELNIDEKNFYRVNPDIVNILLNEGRIDMAKMYIKEVVGRETRFKPLQIKYNLNKDLNLGVLSREDNKEMKKLAKLDRISSRIVIIGNKKLKEIQEPVVSILTRLKSYIPTLFEPKPRFAYDCADSFVNKDFYDRVRVEEQKYLLNRNTNSGNKKNQLVLVR